MLELSNIARDSEIAWQAEQIRMLTDVHTHQTTVLRNYGVQSEAEPTKTIL
jgi:hypothetical protein